MAHLLVPGLDIRTAHRVLEVGCGVARVGRELAPCCARYHGVDISRRLLDVARARMAHLGNVELSHLTGQGLDGLSTGCYDRLICHLVLLHVDATGVQRLLRGFARVLRDDGAAYFDLWNARNPDAMALAQRESLDPRIRRQPHRSRFYTRREVEAWLPAAGLDAVWVSDATFLIQIVAVREDAPDSARRSLARLLAAAGDTLLPRGHLEFACGEDPQAAR